MEGKEDAAVGVPLYSTVVNDVEGSTVVPEAACVEEDPSVVNSPPSEDEDGADNDCPPQNADSEDVLRVKIVKQVEYYFSDENLPNDKYLLKYVKKDKAGFVSIGLVASFRKMRKLTRDIAFIADALRLSSQLVVSSDGKKVGRIHPLPVTELKDSKLCTVYVENLPEDHSKQNLQKIFGGVGNIKSIDVRDPQTVGIVNQINEEKLISGKLHALVEFDSVEAAEKAVETLTDKKDWRNGLRVQPLWRRQVFSKAWGGSSDKNTQHRQDAVSEERSNLGEHKDDVTGIENGEPKGKDGRRNRSRRSKGTKGRANNGIGHGTTSTVHGESAKPPPGPRMPDGTRGFAMGRGRPLVSTQG